MTNKYWSHLKRKTSRIKIKLDVSLKFPIMFKSSAWVRILNLLSSSCVISAILIGYVVGGFNVVSQFSIELFLCFEQGAYLYKIYLYRFSLKHKLSSSNARSTVVIIISYIYLFNHLQPEHFWAVFTFHNAIFLYNPCSSPIEPFICYEQPST